ncbi:hypothetical protein GQ53DRAFT_769178 [Thozetella sp. PMI_491]|nr:hypothetical protein GQ53DRAFT_769178 [Thozetella sp. PMI_491]
MTTGFPSLLPAFTARLNPAEGLTIGNLTIFPISSGTLTSEPGFPVPIEAELQFGSDYVRVEASQTHVHINVKAVFRNKDGRLLSYAYSGLVTMTPEFVPILMGDPNAKTTSYGSAFTHITFETGAEELKELEHGLFVGSAHFVVKEGGGYLVETKISKVVE